MSETKEMLEATCKGLEDKIGQLNMDLKAKQQKSKIHGQKPVKGKERKEKNIVL